MILGNKNVVRELLFKARDCWLKASNNKMSVSRLGSERKMKNGKTQRKAWNSPRNEWIAVPIYSFYEPISLGRKSFFPSRERAVDIMFFQCSHYTIRTFPTISHWAKESQQKKWPTGMPQAIEVCCIQFITTGC